MPIPGNFASTGAPPPSGFPGRGGGAYYSPSSNQAAPQGQYPLDPFYGRVDAGTAQEDTEDNYYEEDDEMSYDAPAAPAPAPAQARPREREREREHESKRRHGGRH